MEPGTDICTSVCEATPELDMLKPTTTMNGIATQRWLVSVNSAPATDIASEQTSVTRVRPCGWARPPTQKPPATAPMPTLDVRRANPSGPDLKTSAAKPGRSSTSGLPQTL